MALMGVAAFVLGFSKTGMPGVGIIAIPLMAQALGGWMSVGATLPLLIFGDLFAVAFYRAHAQWDRLKSLTPWVLSGLTLGTLFLIVLGEKPAEQAYLNPVIGAIVLVMLGLSLVRERLGDRLVPHSRSGTRVTGVLAGFTTLVANAAGPVMSIYLVATGMPKNQFMGTAAWYFLIFNLAKVPLLVLVGLVHPKSPLITPASLLLDLCLFPLILLGALAGKWALNRIPEKGFTHAVLILAAVGAARLLFL
jgi:uncharacterized protein